MAHYLREHGFQAFVLKGGYTAWKRAGHKGEAVPPEDRLLLPTFS